MSDSDDDMPTTPLDDAFLAALDDPEQAGAFYGTLLDVTLFLPVHDEFPEEGGDFETEDMSVSPMFFEVEGEPTAMVFDSEERLAEWADGPTNYIGIPGAGLFLMFDGGEQVAVNLGVAPSSTILTRDDVAALHAHAQQIEAGAQEEDLPAGSEVSVSGPGDVGEAAVAGIVARLAALRGALEQAVLFTLRNGAGAPERLVLGIVPEDHVDAGETARRVAAALAQVDMGGRGLEIAAMSPEGPMIARAREVGLKIPMLDIGSIH